MILVYDHENVLHITNEKGLRWEYDKTDKPQFSFEYDYLFYIPHDDMFEIELGDETINLTEENIAEIEEYIRLCDAPLSITLAKQFIQDLYESTKDRVGAVGIEVNDIANFENMTDVMIAGREGSQDPRRQIARRYMEWSDFAHGINERLAEELRKTLDEDLQEFDHYLNQLPRPPKIDHFIDGMFVDERFNTDTLDVEGGQEDLGEDKRAV
tara:strand:+ start:133 stop:768 length:636 start_codon:yes stop_codon:yes gene_type:complete